MSTKSETLKRHPLAIAWDEWLASDEGQQARAANTLPHNTNHYLENRLHRAFEAGIKAASPADTEQLVRLRETSAVALKWMDWWLDSELCECDGYGHVCGKTERKREADALRNALGAQEGESNDYVR
jgi:hypothetical protein